MQLTMEDVMNFDLLESARVLSAEDHLPRRLVEWVSITESPVENFVRKNELVLTTGIGCEQNLATLWQYVKDVMESEASALAVATGRFIYDIPAEILRYAEDRQFPIIEIPWEVRFADITHEVMKELTRRQQQELKKSEKIQQQLLSIILNGGGATKIAQYVAKQVQAPVFISDRQGNIKGSGRTTQTDYTLWHTFQETKQDTTSEQTSHHPLHQKINRHIVNQSIWIELPIIQDHEHVLGHIYLLLYNKQTEAKKL